jgi:hypothetical protein
VDNVVGSTSVATLAANTFTGTQTIQAAATQDAIKIAGRTGGTSSYSVTITPLALSANRTRSEPDEDGTYALRGANTFTGVQLGPAGTYAAPTWSFSTEPGTGILNDPTNNMGIAVNGARSATIGGSYFQKFAYGSNAKLFGIRANGTYAAPTKVLSGQDLAWFYGQGYYDDGAGGAGYPTTHSGLVVRAAEDFNSVNNQGRLVLIYTCPIGSASGIVAVTIDSSQNLAVVGRITQTGCYAEIHLDSGSTAQSIATGTTYAKLTGIVSNGEAANCTADGTNSKITVTKTGRYRVSFNMSMSSGTNGVTYKAAIFWNGTEQHQVHAQTKLTNGADSQHISASGIVRVTSATTDIDLRVRHDNGGSVNLTPVYANITVDYLGE